MTRSKSLTLNVLSGRLSVCRLPPDASLPDWAQGELLFAALRTPQEFTLVCDEQRVPAEIQQESGWRALKVQGPLPFSLVGVLAAIAAPLAEAQISIFALSTFDTDYVLVSDAALGQALEALRSAGHTLLDGGE